MENSPRKLNKSGGDLGSPPKATPDDPCLNTDKKQPSFQNAPPTSKWTILADILLHLALLVICVATAVVGMGGLVVVKPESWGQTLAAWCIGFSVQAALLPVVNLARCICQVWFAHRVTTSGMDVGEMVAAWSALYTGSLRGAQDMLAGFSPIAVLLILVYVGQVIMVGAIGNLYYLRPTSSISAEGLLPMMDVAGMTTEGFNNVGDVADRLVGNLGGLTSTVYKHAVIPGPEWQISPNVSCDAQSGACTANRIAVSHSFDVSMLVPINNASSPVNLPLRSFYGSGDIISSEMRAINVTVSCKAAPGLRLEFYPGSANTLVRIVGRVDEGGELTGDGVITPLQKCLEIGIMPMQNATGTGADTYYINQLGELYFAVFARNFAGSFRGFNYVLSPTDNKTSIGLGICAVKASVGRTAGKIQLIRTQNALLPAIIAVSNSSFPIIPPPLFAKTAAGFGATQMVTRQLGSLSCFLWACPTAKKNQTTLPWFDVQTGLIHKVPNSTTDWDDQLGRVAAALAELSGVTLAAMTVPNVTTTVPFTVFSQHHASTLNITVPCAAVLLLGALCSLLLVLFYGIYPFGPGRHHRFHNGVRMTESIYTLLSSFDAPVISTQTRSADPKMVRKALGNRLMKLVENNAGDVEVESTGNLSKRDAREDDGKSKAGVNLTGIAARTKGSSMMMMDEEGFASQETFPSLQRGKVPS